MVTSLSGLLGHNKDDAKTLELIKRLISRTDERKLEWQKTPTSVSAAVPGASFGFVYARGLFGPSWNAFVVLDSKGQEIVRVANSHGGAALVLSGALAQPTVQTPLQNAVSTLFQKVIDSSKGDIDHVI